jgi:hypothetical protein
MAVAQRVDGADRTDQAGADDHDMTTHGAMVRSDAKAFTLGADAIEIDGNDLHSTSPAGMDTVARLLGG